MTSLTNFTIAFERRGFFFTVLPFAAERRLGEAVLVDGLPLLVAHARPDEGDAGHEVVAPDARTREEPAEVGQLGHLHDGDAGDSYDCFWWNMLSGMIIIMSSDLVQI